MNWEQKIRAEGIESCGRFYGVYYGVVEDNKDPLKANRLLVTVPGAYGYTDAVRIALPKFGIMGKGYGLHFLPKKNAVVTVSFVNGDPDYPMWEPGPYVDEGAPPEFEGDEVFGFKSREGHLVSIDDENNIITVQHKDGYYLEMKEDKVTVGDDVRVEIHDNGIDIGKKTTGLEPAVLGDQLKDWLDTLMDELIKLKTSDGSTIDPANTAKFIEFKVTLEQILAKF